MNKRKLGGNLVLLKIGVCDDEKIMLRFLYKTIKFILDKKGIKAQIYLFSSGKMLLQENIKLDILFLDINMPDMDGIETGKEYIKQLKGCKECKIIMATGTIERFKEVFKIQPFRFITKPFSLDEIEEVLEETLECTKGMSSIHIYKNRKKYKICQREIKYIMSVGSFVEIYAKGSKYRSETSLSQLEKELEPELFYRVNRNCIVNLKCVAQYKKGEFTVEGEQLHVSSRRKKDFEKKIENM